MKAFEREFKIAKNRLRQVNAEMANELINQSVEECLEQMGVNASLVDVEELSVFSDVHYYYFRVTAWIQETPHPRGTCQNCGELIRTMIFKGSDWCSDDCRKALQRRG